MTPIFSSSAPEVWKIKKKWFFYPVEVPPTLISLDVMHVRVNLRTILDSLSLGFIWSRAPNPMRSWPIFHTKWELPTLSSYITQIFGGQGPRKRSELAIWTKFRNGLQRWCRVGAVAKTKARLCAHRHRPGGCGCGGLAWAKARLVHTAHCM